MNNLHFNFLPCPLVFGTIVWLVCSGVVLAAQVNPGVLIQAANNERVNAVLVMSEDGRPESLPFILTENYRVRRRLLVSQLRAKAQASQAPVRTWLESHGIPYRSYWLVNMIEVSMSSADIAELQARTDIKRIDPNPLLSRREFLPVTKQLNQMLAIGWGVAKINAPQVWATGIKGRGVVIAGEDSGFRWDHEALKAQYRGWNGIAADHNFNWHDAIHSVAGANACGSNSPQPCDDAGHGTHTMGTMVGDDGLGNQIGVAPEAQWIGCRNMDVGAGTPTSYIECMQWLLAPTDLNDQNANPDLAPDIINNSWGCIPEEGCTLGNEIQIAVDTLVNAGIFFVAAAGNSVVTGCNTISAPPATYDNVFVVGATNSADGLALFSSRGPVTGSASIRPDLVAPGVSIYSSLSTGGSDYGNKNGTSMAAPHVAGVAALLMSVNPALKGQPAKVSEILRTSATTTGLTDPLNQSCGGIPNTVWPNYVLGSGRVDAWAAFRLAENIFTHGFEN